MTFLRACWIPLVLSCCAGCYFGRAATNEPLDPQTLARLRPGSTTAREAVELLGAPTEVVQLGRRTAYRYEHGVQKEAATWLLLVAVLNTDLRQDRAWLFFDENDVLTHFAGSFAAERTEYSFPWEDLHDQNPPPGK